MSACAGLLLENGQSEIQFSQQIAASKRRRLKSLTYKTCELLLGSTAETKILFSIVRSFFKGGNRKKSPNALESILFLRKIETFWKILTVMEAIREVGVTKFKQKRKKKLKQSLLMTDCYANCQFVLEKLFKNWIVIWIDQ